MSATAVVAPKVTAKDQSNTKQWQVATVLSTSVTVIYDLIANQKLKLSPFSRRKKMTVGRQ
jgi:hypothetical protein